MATKKAEPEAAAEAQGFDLSTADDVAGRENEGQWIEIHGAEGDPLFYRDGEDVKPVRALVAGTYSRRYRRVEESLRDKRMKKGSRYTGEQFERDQVRLAALCVLDWEGFFASGKPIPCDESNVATVLQKAPWIRDQVTTAMQDHEGFSEASSTD
jgi:hypothetical protein